MGFTPPFFILTTKALRLLQLHFLLQPDDQKVNLGMKRRRIASLIDELRLLSQDLDDSHPIDTGLPMWGLERSATTVERSR